MNKVFKNMRKLLLLSYLLSFTVTFSFAQNVAINADASLPNSSAMLDVKSTDKGFLPPRMTMGQRNLIALPANGLIIYQTDDVTGLYINQGTTAAPNWQLIGPAVTPVYGYFSATFTQINGNSIPQTLFFNLQVANGGIISPTNTDVIIPKSGIYRVAYHITMESNSASGAVQIFVNGVNSFTSAAKQTSAADPLTATISDEVFIALNAGDAVSIRFLSYGGTMRAMARSLTIIQLN